MSEEIKTEKNEEKCFCKCEFVQRTLAVTVGSFIGVYFALNLFCLTHRPPAMMFPHHRHFAPVQYGAVQGDFNKHHNFRPDFKGHRPEFPKAAPEQSQK